MLLQALELFLLKVSLEVIYHSTLVEKDLNIYNTLLENIKNLNIINNTNTINDNFFNLKSLPLKYKLVFLDPPYNSNLLNPAIELVVISGY